MFPSHLCYHYLFNLFNKYLCILPQIHIKLEISLVSQTRALTSSWERVKEFQAAKDEIKLRIFERNPLIKFKP